MRITEMINELELTLISGSEGINNEITGGYVSDLLSDVMGNARDGQVWITLQTHQNIVAVASLKELAAIIIVRAAKPDKDTIEKSNQENIPVLSTDLDTFNITGRLFDLLKKE
jgi:predicted transcriptional regulator